MNNEQNHIKITGTSKSITDEGENILDLIANHPNGKRIYEIVDVFEEAGASPTTIAGFLKRLNYKYFSEDGQWNEKDVIEILAYIKFNKEKYHITL
jgi:hypothetical protein